MRPAEQGADALNAADVQALGAMLLVIGGLVGWLWKHSIRLATAEARIEELQRRVNSHRSDLDARLERIENKLDRIVERGHE